MQGRAGSSPEKPGRASTARWPGVSRLRRGLAPTTPGRDHCSHRLTALGLAPWAAVVVLWVAQAVLCAAAVAVPYLGPGEAAVLIALVAVFVIAWAVLERPAATATLPRAARR